jgi:hypothetical protein
MIDIGAAWLTVTSAHRLVCSTAYKRGQVFVVSFGDLERRLQPVVKNAARCDIAHANCSWLAPLPNRVQTVVCKCSFKTFTPVINLAQLAALRRVNIAGHYLRRLRRVAGLHSAAKVRVARPNAASSALSGLLHRLPPLGR